MVPCAFYFCWANDRKMSLALQIETAPKNTLFVRVFPGCCRNVGKALCWDKSYARSKPSVGGNAINLHSTSRVCPRRWEGVRRIL